MDQIKITKLDIEQHKNKLIKITRDQLFQPIRLQDLADGQQVNRPTLDILVKGHPNCRYELKYKNDTFSAVADNEGRFRFNGVPLGVGRNCFDIINPDKRDIPNQHLQFAVRFEVSSFPFLGQADPVTGQQFSPDDDISGIVRCKKCFTFYYSYTIAECSNRCTNCGHNQFWNHADDEFYQERRT
jgi:hypothetical protein